jgi:hypothetical protein
MPIIASIIIIVIIEIMFTWKVTEDLFLKACEGQNSCLNLNSKNHQSPLAHPNHHQQI